MGILIRLNIYPQAIDEAAWQAFYHQAHAFLARVPTGIARVQMEPAGVHGRERATLSRRLEVTEEEGWRRHLRIDGDLTSRCTGESFLLPLERPEPITGTRLSRYAADELPDPLEDAMVPLNQELGYRLLDAKTQGLPYHHAALGVAMLAEAHFPRAALASGHFTAEQCRESARMIADAVGVEVPLPTLAHVGELYRRLAAPDPTPAAIERVLDVCQQPEDETLAQLREHAPHVRLREWMWHRLPPAGSDPGNIRGQLIRTLKPWLRATGDVDSALDAVMASLADAPEQAASVLVDIGLATPEARLPAPPADAQGAPQPEHARLPAALARLYAHLAYRHPERAKRLEPTLVEKAERLRQQLEELSELRAGLGGHRTPEPADQSHFITHEEGEPLTDRMRATLDDIAERWVADGTWQAHQEAMHHRAGSSPELRHDLLIEFAVEEGIILTELAWAEIDRERDPARLDLLALLARTPTRDLLFHNVRVGVLEHPDLLDALLERIRFHEQKAGR